MQCVHCGKIIRDNSLNCPYCGKPVKEDYFGYQRAEQQARSRQQNPPKKDNSGKIILIIFGVLGGVFALVLMLVFLLSSGSGGSTATMQYDGSFTIAPDCIFSVTDTGNTGMYTIYTRLDGGQVHIETVDAGEELHYLFEEGNYQMRVEKTTGESIMLQMTVSSGCIYNTATLEFDKRQIQTTNSGNTQTTTVSAEEVYYVPSHKLEYYNGELRDDITLTINDQGQIVETDKNVYLGWCNTKIYTIDENGDFRQCDWYTQKDGETSPKLFEQYMFEYNSAHQLTRSDCDCYGDNQLPGSEHSYTKYSYKNGLLDKEEHYEPVMSSEMQITDYTYDNNGNVLTENKYFEKSGDILWSATYHYDGNGALVKYEYTSDFDGYSSVGTLTYNKKGLLEKRDIVRDYDGNAFDEDHRVFLYTYDSSDRLIRQEHYLNGDLIEKQEMEYNEDGLPAQLVSEDYFLDGPAVNTYVYSDYISISSEQKKALDTYNSMFGFQIYDWLDASSF